MNIKSLLFYFLSTIILISCSTDSDNLNSKKDGDNITETYRYFENTAITGEENPDEFEITEGDNVVFFYEYFNENNPAMADDEDHYTLAFQIPTNQDSFKLETSDLENAKALYGLLCYCVPYGYSPVSNGTIEGEKLNDTEWKIEADVSIDIPLNENNETQEFSLDFNGIFELTELEN